MNVKDILGKSEGQLFDRKSARKDPKEIANCAMGFANADGGQVAIGIEDNGELTGFKNYPHRESDIRETIPSYITPPLQVEYEKIPFDNKGTSDFVLLIKIKPSIEMHKNQAGGVTVRRGRQTCLLKFEEIQHLQYDKGLQRFESKKADGAELGNLDSDLISKLGKKINISDSERVLIARDLASKRDDVLEINFAGVLLFGIKPQKWIERARVRIIRYEGIKEATGVNLNIIKDLNFEKSLIEQLDQSAAIIESLLREFTKLNINTKKFETTLEYPPFAWREALVNAVTHREYALTGVDIQVKIFDDRMEIISPGNFPSTVREDNIKYTHFSRNPKIAQVLGDLGYVRELGEGVDRIFEEMAKAGLPEPSFKNSPGMVTVLLKNDISNRKLRKHLELTSKVSEELFDSLNEKERTIILFVLENGKITKKEVSTLIGKSSGTAIGTLKKLQLSNPPILLTVRKSPQDPKAYYILNPKIINPQDETVIAPKSQKGQGELFWRP